ncbi:WhiB family redox-sensing transcriptional regulator [Ornithinibacter aureus]|nr:WhiB family redox-sensing transcriptional regulator [Ornithinibacter aureus]
MTTTADRIDTDRPTTPRHTRRTETTTSRTRPVDQGGDTPKMLTQLLDLHEASDALGEAIPCRENDAELWFADTPDGVEFAKALCGTCPARDVCLSGALDRREPWGVWGGELFVQGAIVARKRPRGRPRKTDVAA